VVSIRLAEEGSSLGTTASNVCLLEVRSLLFRAGPVYKKLRIFQAGSVIMNLFYETTLASQLGGRHPLHLIVMSVTMAALQGFLNPGSLLAEISPFIAPPPDSSPPTPGDLEDDNAIGAYTPAPASLPAISLLVPEGLFPSVPEGAPASSADTSPRESPTSPFQDWTVLPQSSHQPLPEALSERRASHDSVPEEMEHDPQYSSDFESDDEDTPDACMAFRQHTEHE
jgi:hypothetical protein